MIDNLKSKLQSTTATVIIFLICFAMGFLGFSARTPTNNKQQFNNFSLSAKDVRTYSHYYLMMHVPPQVAQHRVMIDALTYDYALSHDYVLSDQLINQTADNLPLKRKQNPTPFQNNLSLCLSPIKHCSNHLANIASFRYQMMPSDPLYSHCSPNHEPSTHTSLIKICLLLIP